MRYLKKISILILYIFFIVFFIFFDSVLVQASKNSEIISYFDTKEKVIAFTFDGGSDAGNSIEILDILKENNVKCTFFLTGIFTENYPDVVHRIMNDGHEIGNHSYTHPSFTTLTNKVMISELSNTDNNILNLTGVTTKPFFRPPYGAYNQNALKVIGAEGYQYTIYWNIDTLDWKGDSASYIIQRIREQLKPGSIVLMHLSGSTNTPEAIRVLIPELKEEGYSFFKISDLLIIETSPYTFNLLNKRVSLNKFNKELESIMQYTLGSNILIKLNEPYINEKQVTYDKSRLRTRKVN